MIFQVIYSYTSISSLSVLIFPLVGQFFCQPLEVVLANLALSTTTVKNYHYISDASRQAPATIIPLCQR